MLPGMIGALAIGVGATAFMDLWALLQKRLFGIPALDYRLVGRWIGHFRQGRFSHDAIGKAAPVRREAFLGWTAHYAIGVLFAAVLLFVWEPGWASQPSLAPALIIGLASVLAPFLLMQPGLGAGIAASRTPKPWTARSRSLIAHLSFGIGLYLAGQLLAASGVLPEGAG
ncbi:DUF2938 domain-containing protein [Stappia taiwanensis]|uniref:DUF2938 domain-containing protein n=2 Tax=Stappia taiwanensis TaxID=992267 RepID=A0A838Y0T2_9HYPH|nr:DUF2938 domain-containing protein [Stappia taiwanensis]MBA4612663.1 DUF2938 domain-containing protein [Stappia taiwanensis]